MMGREAGPAALEEGKATLMGELGLKSSFDGEPGRAGAIIVVVEGWKKARLMGELGRSSGIDVLASFVGDGGG